MNRLLTNNSKKLGSLILLSFVIAGMIACQKKSSTQTNHASAANCESKASITYTVHVKPIMEASCTNCHNNSRRADGISLSDFTNTKDAFMNHNALCTVHQSGGCSPMPRMAAKLSDETITTLDCWVKQGCKE